VAALQPDYIGFIFHPASPRHVHGQLDPALVRVLPASIGRVGVFVNEGIDNITDAVSSFGLTAVQLHGQEPPALCAILRKTGLLIIKAFSITADFDFAQLLPYATAVDFFLFDAPGLRPGGNGLAFDWQVLADYQLSTPFFLAGGLRPEHAAELAALHLPGLAGFDLNSGFETAPGVKDPARLAQFFSDIQTLTAIS
jgi:phosphoribosylanthranilate isomerase